MGRDDVDVTVVVPCFNTERFVDQALVCAEQNASCNMEIIAINDGSTDGSMDVLRAHAARDHRVRVIDKPNEGYGATVNRGLDEARGIYVAVLEPDDYVLPRTYDRLFDLALANAMPDVVKSAYWRILSEDGADGMRAFGYLHGRIDRINERIRLEDEPQLIQYHPAIWSALYAREFLNRERIRMKEVPGAGWVDNPFCVETLAAARSIVYIDDAYYCYREDLASASSAHATSRMMIERWNDREDVLDARGVTDEGIRRANAIVGLRFLSTMLSDGVMSDHGLAQDVRNMAHRMDPRLLRSVDCISPDVVTQALRLGGHEGHAPSKVCYAKHLAQESAWALRNNGVRFLAHNLTLARKR